MSHVKGSVLASTVALMLAGHALIATADDNAWIARSRDLGVMGTDLKLRVNRPTGVDEDAADRIAQLDNALDAAEAELRRVEDLMTDWRPSPLSSLNEGAGKGPQSAPRELAAIISRAIEIGRLTGGAFDLSYASVGQLWNFKSQPPRIPDAAVIRAALAHVGFARLRVDPETSKVTIPDGMRIGLGGIAKGYGVDRAMQTLMDRGIENAIVNAGGDLKVLGHDRGDTWEVAIKHPRDRDRAIAVLRLSNVALVTSGDYERFLEYEGRRYHHIIDPRTGYPSQGAMSASVVAPSAELADALATALCVLGPDKGLALIGGLDRVEAIVVGLDGQVHASEGLRTSLR